MDWTGMESYCNNKFLVMGTMLFLHIYSEWEAPHTSIHSFLFATVSVHVCDRAENDDDGDD